MRLRARTTVRGDVLVGGSPMRAVRIGQSALSRISGGVLTVTDRVSDRVAGYLLDANLADPLVDPADPNDTDGEASEMTVVIPVRDRPQQLERCLASLGNLSVVVVDDASIDSASIRRVTDAHGARYLRLPVNQGPAGARNAGLQHVRTTFVAFVDSDVTAEASMLVQLMAHFRDARLALVGPLVRGRFTAALSGRDSRWFEKYDEAASSLALGNRPSSVRPGAAVGWLPSACLVGRTLALRQLPLPGFDASMRVGEDVDLVWRLLDAGWRVRYDPSHGADHDTRSSLAGWLGRKLIYGSGGAALAARHGRHGAPAVLSVVSATSAAAVLIRRRWSAPALVAGVGYTWWRLNRRLPSMEGRVTRSMCLSVEGTAWAVRQESALLLRHWWPLTVVLFPFVPAVRRAVASALIVDAVAARLEMPTAPYLLVGRRLDDLAYGAGLWLGALRARSIECLLPRRPRS
ncbi:mycofactocin biosynthesis glycosyltransferase MftF [Nocardioides sp. CER19]|uniref:mycofactocin biosynthesis glycosyltransferase MftF n=1 Tax=Nocardioides sp. CER19 TaxID=3038538 RepID=UPI002447C8CD|nr:mycofactocin biosynthesis glycosyltransferase MftF [Nocardioides sp. CER19]MDH2416142.1 mycofactocin biosynthesis glycosyltransferase MftF [Nocardioides sp. CER19]